jgi:hypothetical protein
LSRCTRRILHPSRNGRHALEGEDGAAASEQGKSAEVSSVSPTTRHRRRQLNPSPPPPPSPLALISAMAGADSSDEDMAASAAGDDGYTDTAEDELSASTAALNGLKRMKLMSDRQRPSGAAGEAMGIDEDEEAAARGEPPQVGERLASWASDGQPLPKRQPQEPQWPGC